ncbi:MAG: DALR domain-containing protein, partial [Candidatus Limnocylindrus sp.]
PQGDSHLVSAGSSAKGDEPADTKGECPGGVGIPGWHLECSAMSMRYLGESFDLHTGGIDLVFPHHEDEIAQSEAATGKTFVRTWMHCAHLHVSGDKMSKSLGNISRVSDLLANGAEPRALRLALISAHYRTNLNYNDDSLTAAASAIARIDAFLSALNARSAITTGDSDVDQRASALAEGSWDRFATAMDDDLAVPEALAVLFDLVRDGNRLLDANCSGAGAQALLAVLEKINAVLAVLPDRAVLPVGAESLLAERVAARAAKDWARSVALRDELASLGVLIDDGRDGQRWRLAGPQS